MQKKIDECTSLNCKCIQGRRTVKKFEHLLEQLLWGDLDRFNPDLPMDEQAELLPYDVRWEFPRNRVQLGIYKDHN